MMDRNGSPVSAFAMYSQKSSNSSQNSNKIKRKLKQHKTNKISKKQHLNDSNEDSTVSLPKTNDKLKNYSKEKACKLETNINNNRTQNTKTKKRKIESDKPKIKNKNEILETKNVNNKHQNEILETKPVNNKHKLSDDDFESPPQIKNKKRKVKKQKIEDQKPTKKFSLPSSINENSVKTGEEIFQWIIGPIEVEKFFRENWEKQPIIVKRSCESYYSYLLTSEEIDDALRKKQIFFTKNIDITSYSPETGLRETHNPPGRATAPLVWDYYSNGCSIRILNPQTFFPKVHALNAALQEYFGCFVGANVYLTPRGTQGFAPHYDDIEAFVIQLEGQKLWKLYLPRSPAETLPRFSSSNFTEADLGPPIQEVLLEAGDMLYFPRGIIHQGNALEHTHSLHITLSMYQKNSWADLLETLLPAALKTAVEEDVSFREGLPMHFLSHLGLVHSDKNSEIRTLFLSKLQTLISKLVPHAPVDAAVDQIGKKFIHDSLPPYLKSSETARTVFGDGEKIKNGVISNQAEMCLGTRIKLIRYNCIRLVGEEDTFRIYYSISNSKEYHAEDLQYLEIDEDLAPAIDALINTYPNYLSVEDLPIENDIAKVQIASDLWEHGILMTEDPLGYSSDE